MTSATDPLTAAALVPPTEPATAAEQHAVAAQQQAITETAPLFVRACPGAGKTHVIVSRHLRGPSASLRQGRALLSFTRAAANQMRRRCHREGRPEAAAFPHYIGTLDAFIWDVLVQPCLPASTTLQLLDTWDRINAEVKLDRTVPLSAFTFQRDSATGKESARRELLSYENDRLIAASQYPWEQWVSSAIDARRAAYRNGYVTGYESRLQALAHLKAGETVVGPLRSRFAEIVIDEAQDCSVLDLEIIDWLRRSGIPLVVVADPDQTIYGWRDADLTQLTALESELGQTIELSGNWRSSTTVCQLATTLRAGNRPPDLAVRPLRPAPPIILLPTTFPKKGQPQHKSNQPVVDVFLDHVETHLISASGCLITARNRTHLPSKARRATGNTATRLARARQVVYSAAADPVLVDDACRTAARLLLRYWHPKIAGAGSLEAHCAATDVAFGDLIRHAYAFLHALPEPHTQWRDDVNSQLRSWPRPPNAAPKGPAGTLGGKTTVPKAVMTSAAPYRADNIHQVKGDEYPAVLLLLPDDDAATLWINGDPTKEERLRDWYVAVTRAQHLIAVALLPAQTEQLAAHLRALCVPIQIG